MLQPSPLYVCYHLEEGIVLWSLQVLVVYVRPPSEGKRHLIDMAKMG